MQFIILQNYNNFRGEIMSKLEIEFYENLKIIQTVQSIHFLYDFVFMLVFFTFIRKSN